MTFPSMNNIFTNAPIQVAWPSYLSIDYSTAPATVILEWSFQNPNTLYPFAQTMTFSNTNVGSSVQLPNASYTSIGQTIQLQNQGTNTVTILLNDGTTTLLTVAAGLSYTLTLTSNLTSGENPEPDANGTWLYLQNGAGSSSVVAASLIDSTSQTGSGGIQVPNSGGLGAFTTYLKDSMKVVTFPNNLGSYTQTTGERGNVIIWTGASANYNLLPATQLGDGFTWTVFNASKTGGVLTFVPAGNDLINGSFSATGNPFQLNADNAFSFSTDGAGNFYCFSNTQTNTNSSDLVQIDLNAATGGNLSLSEEQALFNTQKFINGTGDINVFYPPLSKQYVAYNASSSATIIIQLQGESSPLYQYTLPPNTYMSVFSDSAHLFNTPNVLFNATLTNSILNTATINTGTLNTPTLITPTMSNATINTATLTNATAATTFNTAPAAGYQQNTISIYSLMRAYG